MTQTQYDRMAETLKAERARTDKLLQMLEMQQAMNADLMEQLHDLKREQEQRPGQVSFSPFQIHDPLVKPV